VLWNAPQVDREQPLVVGVLRLEHRTREGDPGVVVELVHDAEVLAITAAYSPTATRSLASSSARCASAPRPASNEAVSSSPATRTSLIVTRAPWSGREETVLAALRASTVGGRISRPF
jgi:hypothetical protein